MLYPLARNQYTNNSPGISSCIRAGANAGATCIRTEISSLKNLANMRKMIPLKLFSCIRVSANTGPACIRAKIDSTRCFPACIGFVPGGNRWGKKQRVTPNALIA